MRKTETLDKQTQRKSFCPSVEGFLKNALMQVQLTKWSVTETIFFFFIWGGSLELAIKKENSSKKKSRWPSRQHAGLEIWTGPGFTYRSVRLYLLLEPNPSTFAKT